MEVQRLKLSKQDLAIYAVTDRKWLKEGETLAQQVEKAIQGGATIIQLREKHLCDEEFLAQAKVVKQVTDRYGVPLIINDNVDVAIAVDAAGVHVGQEDMGAGEVRRKLGPQKILGVSAQTVAHALAAQAAGAEYLGVGAVFPTSSKDDAVEVDKETLQAICGAVEIPAVAIGGITADNMTQLQGTGIVGVAVISAIFGQPDVKLAAQTLAQQWRAMESAAQ